MVQDGNTETEQYAVIMQNGLPTRIADDMETAKAFVENHDTLSIEDGTSIISPIKTIHMCELCGERPSETLTADSHPEGVNHLVCEVCADE